MDDTLTRSAREDPAAARLARLRLLAGLSVAEAAGALGVAQATAFRHWTCARAWLRAELADNSSPESGTA